MPDVYEYFNLERFYGPLALIGRGLSPLRKYRYPFGCAKLPRLYHDHRVVTGKTTPTTPVVAVMVRTMSGACDNGQSTVASGRLIMAAKFSKQAAIVGIANTEFSKNSGCRSQLAAEAVRDALADVARRKTLTVW